MVKSLALSLTIIGCLAIPQAIAESPKQTTIQLLTQPTRALVVPVALNKQYLGAFMIDTGSYYTVLTPRMAAKMGIVITDSTPRVSVITGNGETKMPLVTIDTLTLGDITLHNVPALVQSLGDDLMLGGLLGLNAFQGMSIGVDGDKLILKENK